jgi:hypothetical protein
MSKNAFATLVNTSSKTAGWKKVRIPFRGFYGTLLDEQIEEVLDPDSSHYDDENPFPEELQGDFPCNMQGVYEATAKKWADHVLEYLGREYDVQIKYTDVELWMPREYNFLTDQIEVKMPISVLKKLYAKLDKAAFADTIKASFTARSGFIPFYSNELLFWTSKPRSEYDEIEWETVLQTLIDMADSVHYLEEDFIEREGGNGFFSEVVWSNLYSNQE